MNPIPEPEIVETDFGDGDIAVAVILPIAPFGDALFAGPDAGENSRRLLQELIAHWRDLWPQMLELLQDGIRDYDVETKIGRDEFIGYVARTKPGFFMSDKSDVFLRLEFEEPPRWDYFLHGWKIVHSQPVF